MKLTTKLRAIVTAKVAAEMRKSFGPLWGSMTEQRRKRFTQLCIESGIVRINPSHVQTAYLKSLTHPDDDKETTMTTPTKKTPAKLSTKAAKVMTAAKVKDAGARLSTKRYEVKGHNGAPLMFGSTALEHPSEYDNALIGAWWKMALRRLGVTVELSDFEKSLLTESATKDRWVGTAPNGMYWGGGSPDAYAPSARVKALLDDTVSGGLYLNPVVLDTAIVTKPLLSGQLFPHVDVVPVTGRRVSTPVMENMTVTWGQSAGTAITPMNTAALVSPLDTTVMPVAGVAELSNELIADSPVDVGATVVNLFGERLKSELDRVIAKGDGVVEPLGIVNTSGLVAVTSDSGTGGPPTVADAEALIFAVPLQYRDLSLNPAFIGNDTTYRRFRGIPVGPADERRVFGMDHQSYAFLEYPFRVANDLPNVKLAFGCLKKYRLFQRLGMEPIRESGGRTLALSNLSLVGLRARFGGRVVDANAFALMADAQS